MNLHSNPPFPGLVSFHFLWCRSASNTIPLPPPLSLLLLGIGRFGLGRLAGGEIAKGGYEGRGGVVELGFVRVGLAGEGGAGRGDCFGVIRRKVLLERYGCLE